MKSEEKCQLFTMKISTNATNFMIKIRKCTSLQYQKGRFEYAGRDYARTISPMRANS